MGTQAAGRGFLPADQRDIYLTVDVLLFTLREDALHVLLIQRGTSPYQGLWAIPGGFVRRDESLERAALRELSGEAGVEDYYLEQLYTFGDPGRDPRGRVVTVAYYALVASDRITVKPGKGAVRADWFKVSGLPRMAFDHGKILAYALERLRSKLEYTTVGFQLLPEKFTLGALQRVYEAILGKSLDKRNFRRKMALLDIVTPLDEWTRGGAQRPAQLYTFSARSFERIKDKGILFPF